MTACACHSRDEAAVARAWQDLATRIGPRVLVAPMVAAPGVEMLLGMFHDEQFGPVVVLGFGGVHVEALADVVYALPPFGAAEARAAASIASSCARCSTSRRHGAPLGDRRFLRARPRDSRPSSPALGDAVGEIDLNPVIVHADGCAIVDALIVGRQGAVANQPNMRQAV